MCVSVELDDVFDNAERINVYNNGVFVFYDAGSEAFNEILASWKQMIDCAHLMPAFGVSLDNYTRTEMRNGVWVEFEFDQMYECNGMPFEKLLINVEKSFSGFNLIRYNEKDGYDGRCFYYSLNTKDMSDLYNILLNL